MNIKFDFDSSDKPVFSFDAMTDEQYDKMIAEIPGGPELDAQIRALAADAEDEKRLRGLVAKGVAAGANAIKGGGSLSLLGLIV